MGWSFCSPAHNVWHTNNFVNSHNQKIKFVVGSDTSIPDMFENLIKLDEQKQSKMSLTKTRLKLKKNRQILHSQACISDTLEAIYKICAPYAENIKQELVLSVEKILLVNNNTVTDPNGIHSNSCTCFISQYQK